ncbi:hypothetical protein V1264_009842 [Littorina saxatilis]
MTSSMAANPQVFKLRCGVQEYDWGKIGLNSEVASLKAGADPDFRIDPTKTYAELWMGTHPNCPSMVVIPGQEEKPLIDWVNEHPDSLGSEVKDYYKGSLPFLFKVLSVRTSLSIQAHPNKVHAEMLHKSRPDLYKDPNHKPEMAIALTPFLGLCGFRPIKEVARFMEQIEELRNAVGQKHAIKLITASRSIDPPLQREAMKDCFSALMESHKDTVKNELKSLVQRVHDTKNRGDDLKPLEGDIMLKLNKEFPDDAGAFCVYFLNVVRLEPGEAMFLEANLPHAYLSGDCMECMACSDNVVRAGLTHKYIDKHTLVEMLDYTGRPVNRTKFQGIQDKQDVPFTIFRPPVPDFGVSRYEVPSGTPEFKLPSINSASICIVINGSGNASNSTLGAPLNLCRGSVFFVAAQQEVNVSIPGQGEGMLLFRAYAGFL